MEVIGRSEVELPKCSCTAAVDLSFPVDILDEWRAPGGERENYSLRTRMDYDKKRSEYTKLRSEWSGYRPITFTRMFEPRHNVLSNIRTNVRKYVVTWLEHSREINRRYPDHS